METNQGTEKKGGEQSSPFSFGEYASERNEQQKLMSVV